MKKDTEKEASNILNGLDNKEVDEEVKALAKNVDSKDLLRDDLFSFLRNRMNRIEEAETLKMKVQAEIEAQLERGELSYDQVVGLYTSINRQIRDHTDSIMTILKPVPGANSPLTDSMREVDRKDNVQEFFEKSDPDTLRVFDSLLRRMKKVNPKDVAEDLEIDEEGYGLPDSLLNEDE